MKAVAIQEHLLFFNIQAIVHAAFAPGPLLANRASLYGKRRNSLSLYQNRNNSAFDILDDNNDASGPMVFLQRRNFMQKTLIFAAGNFCLSAMENNAAFAKSVDVDDVLSQLKLARAQLDPIPNLIKEEKWDSVRAILGTSPLVDCWGKTSRPLLKLYVEAQDDLPNGDELSALELKEEALDHFRFLDMAAYNNVFNPIKAEGENGATKELIRSYYDDPVREYQACVKVLDGLIALAN